jgi:hypothetical protein
MSTVQGCGWFRGSKLRYGPRGDAIPISRRWDAAGARYAGTFEGKRIGCGTVRNDRWESGAAGTARPLNPPRVRWKYAASPYCRTSRNARSQRSGWGPPRHKIASRSLGSATAARASLRPRSLAGCAFGSDEDCRYDKQDKSNSFTPGKFSRKHTRCLAVMASSICARLVGRTWY